MSGTLKHAFTSAKADGTDSTKVRASNWNADHTFAGGALGSVLVRDTGATDGASWIAAVASGSVFVSAGVGVAPAWSATPSLTSLTLSSALGVASGGTGLASYAVGDLLYASGAATIAKLVDVATGSVLVSGGVGVAPAWSATPTLTDLTLTGVLKAADGLVGSPGITFASQTTMGLFRSSAGVLGVVSSGAISLVANNTTVAQASSSTSQGLSMRDTMPLSWNFNATPDLFLFRDAANTLAQRNGTTAQRFNFYNTFTDASNYERANFVWSSNVFVIQTQAAGTGTVRQLKFDGGSTGTTSISFAVAGTDKWRLNGSNFGIEAVTDNTYDIGASGANRPRTVYAGTSVLVGGATGGLGYASGAGGTVTQATSKATGVTLSKVTGQITLNAAALAGDTTVSFVLTNTAIAATDVLILNHISGGTAGSYTLNARSAAGSATIDVRNITTGSLSEAIVISFAVIKAVTA